MIKCLGPFQSYLGALERSGFLFLLTFYTHFLFPLLLLRYHSCFPCFPGFLIPLSFADFFSFLHLALLFATHIAGTIWDEGEHSDP